MKGDKLTCFYLFLGEIQSIMSIKQLHNTEEAISYLLEELLWENDESTDLESSDDDKRDPDFVPNYSNPVEENSTLSLPMHISVQNTDTSDYNSRDLSDDADSTEVSVALPAIHTTACDWKKIEVDYEVSLRKDQ